MSIPEDYYTWECVIYEILLYVKYGRNETVPNMKYHFCGKYNIHIHKWCRGTKKSCILKVDGEKWSVEPGLALLVRVVWSPHNGGTSSGLARGSGPLRLHGPEGTMDKKELIEYSKSQLKEDPDMASAVAAIRTLLEYLRRDTGATTQGLRENLTRATEIPWHALQRPCGRAVSSSWASAALPPWNTLITPNVRKSWGAGRDFPQETITVEK